MRIAAAAAVHVAVDHSGSATPYDDHFSGCILKGEIMEVNSVEREESPKFPLVNSFAPLQFDSFNYFPFFQFPPNSTNTWRRGVPIFSLPFQWVLFFFFVCVVQRSH
jgi:hypothetical protein